MVVYIYEKVYLFSLTTITSTTKRKISVKNKEYTNNEFKYQREEKIQTSLAKEMGHRVVGGACRVAVGLEPLAIAGSELREGTLVRLGQQLFG